jgi:proline iminopeptidase
MGNMPKIITALWLCLMLSCVNTPKTEPKALELHDFTQVQSGGVRMIPIQTDFGTYQVWTKKYGNNPKVKVLLLHGGPAMTHEYMECFESFLPAEGYEIYQYDQLGSYYSDQPKQDSLWFLPRFVDEVEQVRKALGLNEDNFYLLGNSWGGMLAMEYALKHQQHLKGLIVSNMQASFPEYAAYNATLRSQMRPSLIDTLERYEKKNDYANPIYLDLVINEYYRKHICRMNPFPNGFQRALDHTNGYVYALMQGPSEFVPGGRLQYWDIMAQLKNIAVPTLMIGAKYDTMDPAAMERMSKFVQNGKYLYCPEGSHLSMWDDQKHYYPGVIDFIKEVEAADR